MGYFFSIITPTFKRPILLARAINSVRNQSFKDYEHIIIDDANDPETKAIVDSFHDKKIIFHQHDVQKGAAGAYNSGIRLAKGNFLTFLDDDDEFLPLFLEKVHNCFSECDSEIAFLWTGISSIRDTESGEYYTGSKVWPSEFKNKESGFIAATTIGNGYGLCIRRECVEKIGMYDETIRMGQDADYMFRLIQNFAFKTIPIVLVKIHQHYGAQLTDNNNNLDRLKFREKILERYQYLLKKYPELHQIHYKHIANLSYGLHLKNKGRGVMLDLIGRHPFLLINYLDLLTFELLGKDFYETLFLRKIKKFFVSSRRNNQIS